MAYMRSLLSSFTRSLSQNGWIDLVSPTGSLSEALKRAMYLSPVLASSLY